jgi:hypothetical protein
MGDTPGALRAIVEVLAPQAAHLRRSHDQLWDDQMIESCANWAVPYIGALLNTRVLPADAARGARIDVAKTIYYRKRAGTPAILEQLAADIAGWEGVLSEGFRRLARMPHPLDAPRDALAAPALAPMANPLEMSRNGKAFDSLQHMPDIALPNGRRGQAGINRATLHLYRLRTAPLRGVWPRPHGVVDDAYTFDPSGRDVPLFARRGRIGSTGDALDWDGWQPAQAWDMPAPIACRLLGEEVYELSVATQEMLRGLLLPDGVVDELSPLLGRRLNGLSRLRVALLTCASSAQFLVPAIVAEIRAQALIRACGKAQLLPRSIRVEVDEAPAAPLVQTQAGALANWADPRMVRGLVIDPERGRFRFPAGTPAGRLRTDHFTGYADRIGAGGFARARALPVPDTSRSEGAQISAAQLPQNGALRLNGSATWGQPANRANITSLNIHASAGARPYIRLTSDWVLSAANAGNAILHLDGLWLGADSAGLALVLAGDWEEVRLSNITLDPGGALSQDQGADILPHLALRITGNVENLILEQTIAAEISTQGGQIEALRAEDCILQHPQALAPLPDTDITLNRCTILGAVGGRRVDISNSLIIGPVRPQDAQNGCFRFSAAPQGSALPHSYRSVVLPAGQTLFASQRFGNPDFARLRRHALAALRMGGENGQEIGAFHRLKDNARLAGLRTKISEYAPFGILPIYQFET